MQDDFGNYLFGTDESQPSVQQNWKILEFFGVCDAEHECTCIRENVL